MLVTDYLTLILLLAGAGFFLAGTVGLLRFPDVFTRLHALTKADNVGLDFMRVADHRWLSLAFRLVLLLLLLSQAVGVGYVVLSLPDQAVGLSERVRVNMEMSGVQNQVTAVLLNFR